MPAYDRSQVYDAIGTLSSRIWQDAQAEEAREAQAGQQREQIAAHLGSQGLSIAAARRQLMDQLAAQRERNIAEAQQQAMRDYQQNATRLLTAQMRGSSERERMGFEADREQYRQSQANARAQMRADTALGAQQLAQQRFGVDAAIKARNLAVQARDRIRAQPEYKQGGLIDADKAVKERERELKKALLAMHAATGGGMAPTPDPETDDEDDDTDAPPPSMPW